MNLSDKILKCRKQLNLSQEELANKLYISRQAVSRWENGTALPDAQNILQLSQLFGVSTDYLLNDNCIEPEATEIPKEEKKKLGALEIILLVLGSPIWVSLIIGGAAVILSLYISLWALIISLWAVFGAFIGCSLGSLICAVSFFLGQNFTSGTALLGAGVVLAGLSILLFYGCRAATNGIIMLTKKIFLLIKNRFNKEAAQ